MRVRDDHAWVLTALIGAAAIWALAWAVWPTIERWLGWNDPWTNGCFI